MYSRVVYTTSTALTSTTTAVPQPTGLPGDNVPPTQPSPAQLMMLFAARARADHEAMSYYAAALAGVMALFVIFYMANLSRKFLPTRLVNLCAIPIRFFKRYLIRTGPKMTSVGHALISAGYLALNILFIFIHSDYDAMPMQSVIAARTGWLALANICFTVFLSLRNTPLAYLTAWSYERLKFLHGIAGITIVVHTIIHGACYSSFFIQQNNAIRLQVLDEIYGIVAGFMLLSMVIVAVILSRKHYELFYILHVLFFILSLIFIGLHHPDVAENVAYAVAVAGGMWVLDHAVRLTRLGVNSVNNTATVYPLPNGATKIVFKKCPSTARSGEHAYLWIPRIRLLETHPFTISAVEPLEFVVSAHDGFTRDLHEFASKNPGADLSASVQGPYGYLPDLTSYNRIVLIAGGSGASFTVGVALNILARMRSGSEQKVVMVWAVKKSAVLSWFSTHLQRLLQHPNFSVSLFITDEPLSSSRDRPHTQDEGQPGSTEGRRSSRLSDSDTEALRFKESDVQNTFSPSLNYGRPDVAAVIRHAVEESTPTQRVIVMGCGPQRLMQELRNNVAREIRATGPSVDLHCEQFGW
ncbi:Ferric/cupric reductase transmembrane component 2-like protein 3 [Colletotrichum truncatum]|uniref:Ferric/cupric reductase transmembrane component 2-like protein 3 n=1 Tax=Colletotrichum truncatum TaxID=5467 RepID=A0ACC3YHA5_COLTU|nr:Ferric/cupric reductase transmembrane component 2-like protein 3 [Colletotrichum truncatum]KAF6792839.1 Ferric/cupric reductase transmembrane component 2-like protein 3 [Colletotrichum truncatum]